MAFQSASNRRCDLRRQYIWTATARADYPLYLVCVCVITLCILNRRYTPLCCEIACSGGATKTMRQHGAQDGQKRASLLSGHADGRKKEALPHQRTDYPLYLESALLPSLRGTVIGCAA